MMPMQLEPPAPSKYYGPFDAKTKLTNLQNLAQQQQEGQLKLEEEKRKVAEGQKLRDVYAKAPDLRSALSDVYKINPIVALAMTKSLHEQEKSALETEAKRIEVGTNKAHRLASLAGSATDEPSWHRAITKALDEGLMTAQEAQEHLAKGWGPQSQSEMQQAFQMGLSAKEQGDARLAKLKEDRDALDAQHKRDMEPHQLQEAQDKARKEGMQADDLQRGMDASKLAAAARQGPAALAAELRRISEDSPDRIAPFMSVNDKTKPEDILRIGMKPHEVAAADTAALNAENNVGEYELELRAAKGDKNAKTALANRQRDKVAQAAAGGAATRGLDREIAQYGKPFDDIVKGVDGQLDKILDAEKMIAGGAVSQALAVPKILTALVSGQGSGVRITQSELNSITKARGVTGDLEGWFNKLKGDGTLTAAQKLQMNAILSDVRERIIQKKMIARQVSDEMQSSTSREGVLAAAKKGRDGLDAHAAQGGAGPQAKIFPADKVHAYAVAHNIDDATAKTAITKAGYTVQ